MTPITPYQYWIGKILLVIAAILVNRMPGDVYKVKALEDLQDLNNALFEMKETRQ